MIVVVGGGAAGLMAGIHAAAGGAKVLIVERTADGGRKILISGGGRCNVLPSKLEPGRFVTDSSPHSLRKLLLAWPLDEQKTFFEGEVGIPLALEPETGKFFPVSNRARLVRDGLIALARRRGAELQFGASVVDVQPVGSGWRVVLSSGQTVAASSVILAAGGLSVPATGSDGTGLAIAERLGLPISPTYPALTPLLLDPPVHAGLAGISLSVTLTGTVGKTVRSARGGFLFTHHGYSGPSVLDLSHLATRARLVGGAPAAFGVRWSEEDGGGWRDLLVPKGAEQVATVVRRRLPARLADWLLAEAKIGAERALSQITRDERNRLVALLTDYPLAWTGDEGYKKAEVTGGGVVLGAVQAATLEAKALPGLFLCGEILDAFGPIGGHNFAWAWATGRTAGVGAARRELS